MPCDSARLGFLGTQRTNHQTDDITVENEAIRSRSHAMTESTERNAEKRKETLLLGSLRCDATDLTPINVGVDLARDLRPT